MFLIFFFGKPLRYYNYTRNEIYSKVHCALFVASRWGYLIISSTRPCVIVNWVKKQPCNFYSRTCPLRTPFHLLMNHVRSLAKIEITSWAGKGARTGFSHELVMYQKSNERAQRASEISDTNNECENSVQAPCPWSNLHTYRVNISSFYLGKLLFI